MSGVLKSGGLVKFNEKKPPLQKMNNYRTSFFETPSFESENFEKADLSGYYNAGEIMRHIPETVKIPIETKAEKNLRHMSEIKNAGKQNVSKTFLRAGLKNPNFIKQPDLDIEDEQDDDFNQSALLSKSREEILAEYEQIKIAKINEGQQELNEAKSFAAGLIDKTHKDIHKLYQEANAEAAELKRKADEDGYKEGYERGYDEGNAKGYEEGYGKGLRKCKDTLKELMAMLEELPAIKDAIYKKYEHELFDAIFTISSKITIDSLKQKDKSVIQKMLREAAKNFRNSEYIKISLSKLDVEKIGSAELDSLREIFKSNQHVEFEIIKDAPNGTLILDNGSEITDAGIATQLMMIEKLGKGKFRDKNPSEDEL